MTISGIKMTIVWHTAFILEPELGDPPSPHFWAALLACPVSGKYLYGFKSWQIYEKTNKDMPLLQLLTKTNYDLHS